MASFTTNVATTNTNQQKLIRTDVWGSLIQEELQEELMAQSVVNFITGEFPDGDKLHIPTLASLTARDYTESSQITFDDPVVSELTLTIDKYKQSGVAVTDKMKEDAFYMEVLNSKFPQQCVRALMEQLETDIWYLHKDQTNNDPNTINGVAHRFVASGSGSVITLDDVYKAKLALDRANVSKAGRKAIVSPKQSYTLLGIDNVIRQDVYGANSHIAQGFGSTSYLGMFGGFEFYESNMLDEATALDHESGGSLTACMFLGPEAFIGAVRSQPDIEQSRDWQYKRDVFHVTTRYGLKTYRPESVVTVLCA